MKKYIAEFIGTLVLVFFGTGVAALTGGNMIITPFAFGFAIVAMAYVIGNISGCHINPAVSLAMLINGKMKVKDFIFYVIAQILGAFAGSALLYFLIKTCAYQGFTIEALGLGTNGFGEASVAQISLAGALLLECVLTFVFVYTILGVTSDEKKDSSAGIVIGLTLALVHIFGLLFTGTSVNPARSLGPALMTWIAGQGTTALAQVWVFIVAPLVGAAIAALVFMLLNKEKNLNNNAI